MALKGVENFTEDMQNITYLAMAVGLLWSVICIVIGGMLLAGSGSNPQKRSKGVFAIILSGVGIFIIYKAYTIAGWTISLG